MNATTRLADVTDPLGNATSFSYDSDGNMLSATDPLGNTTSFTYNTAGQPVTATDALGNQKNFPCGSSWQILLRWHPYCPSLGPNRETRRLTAKYWVLVLNVELNRSKQPARQRTACNSPCCRNPSIQAFAVILRCPRIARRYGHAGWP